MNNQTKSRIISAALLIVILASYIHVDRLKRSQLGREAFLESQAKRYDRHFAHPDSFSSELAAGVVLAGGLIVVYELIALGVCKVLKTMSPDE
ncbi:MAG: hypothetical protein ACLPT4_12445 [Verrucomicrobiia bacterium]